MIRIENVTKSYLTRGGRRYILRDFSAVIPDRTNCAIIGKNGAGKSTLLRMMGGIDMPDRGRIIADCSVSYPLGIGGNFQGALSARENLRFMCRIYGRPEALPEIIAQVEDFTELGDYFDEPVRSYSSGMKSRLSFAISLSFHFDVLLMDEVLSVNDPYFRKKAMGAVAEMRGRSSIILVSHSAKTMREMCDMGIVVHEGRAHVFDHIDKALSWYDARVLNPVDRVIGMEPETPR